MYSLYRGYFNSHGIWRTSNDVLLADKSIFQLSSDRFNFSLQNSLLSTRIIYFCLTRLYTIYGFQLLQDSWNRFSSRSLTPSPIYILIYQLRLRLVCINDSLYNLSCGQSVLCCPVDFQPDINHVEMLCRVRSVAVIDLSLCLATANKKTGDGRAREDHPISPRYRTTGRTCSCAAGQLISFDLVINMQSSALAYKRDC